MTKVKVAVVSPFIDKRHGTERRVAEYVSRLADDFEIHVYSQRVEHVDFSKIVWHHIPEVPGPHLVQYLFWFIANHLWRWWDRSFGGLNYDLLYSPGINCLDADVVTVHIVFDEFYRRVRDDLRLRQNPVRSWPRLIHRRLYYSLIRALERWIYPKSSLVVGVVSQKVAEELRRLFKRTDQSRVVYQGIDFEVFNPEARLLSRPEMRRRFGLADGEFVLLVIGNGWKNKGLHCVLEAMARLNELPLKLIVVGKDDRAPFEHAIERLGLKDRVCFLLPSPDVMQFYAAADLYVGPSLQDSFALPPSEAMACGLPVITSVANGGAEIMTNGMDGLVLQDPRDVEELARLIRCVVQDRELQLGLSQNASVTARQYSWERSTNEMRRLFQDAIERKTGHTRATIDSLGNCSL